MIDRVSKIEKTTPSSRLAQNAFAHNTLEGVVLTEIALIC
jgi:hypothetical protein